MRGFRDAPLSPLPWRTPLHRCQQRGGRTVDCRAAHAAAFGTDHDARALAACGYHQYDWPRVVRVFAQSLGYFIPSIGDFWRHREFETLTEDERQAVAGLLTQPIDWGDGDDGLTNGRHRFCALSAAGVARCPV